MKNFKKISLALSLAASIIVSAVVPALGQTTLTCTPAFATVAPGQTVSFNVTGGNGVYTFTGNGITSTTTSNTSFPASFSTTGVNNFTVSSGGITAGCSVNVAAATSLSCVPSSATVAPGQTVSFNVTGGNGTYSFSGTGVNATTTTNTSFPASFSTTGVNTVSVSSGGQTANCSVNVQPVAANTGTLACFPTTSVVAPGQNVNFLVTGGNGTYSFSGNGITPLTTTNNVFPTSFSSTGLNTFTVSSNGQTASCSVNVQSAAATASPSVVTCISPTTPVYVGQPATFTAIGGTGTYTFSSPSLNISNPVGTTFNASFATPGIQTVTATSNGISGTCAVNVLPAASTGGSNTGTLTCTPATQTGLVGSAINFSASGGNGSYVWSATDLVLSNPTGNGFTARYGSLGNHIVTVSSNGQTANCSVSILAATTPGLPNTGFAPVGR